MEAEVMERGDGWYVDLARLGVTVDIAGPFPEEEDAVWAAARATGKRRDKAKAKDWTVWA